MSKTYSKAAAGTFVLNKSESIHRWYPYLEGYSSCLIDDLICDIGIDNIKSIYDPFCGTGTTTLVASKYGITSYYSETNPFMRMVIEAKINCVRRLRASSVGSGHLRVFLESLNQYSYRTRLNPAKWDGFEKYFDEKVLSQILDLKKKANQIEDEDTRQIAIVILASVIVRSSKMKRQGDLRFAKDGEKNAEDWNVVENYKKKIEEALIDIDSNDCPTLADTICLGEDSRDINAENLIDCVITSPPYLNGTNYVRNTKLELKLCDFIVSENDLPEFHSKGIIAGINNVSKRNTNFETPDCVKTYLEKLEPVAYDKRIPIMVAGYFHDMKQVIERLSCTMKNGGIFIMDIGDSQFAGVHIPTHELLIIICKDHGFELVGEEVLRKRRSKNGMILSQRLLKFRLHKDSGGKILFMQNAKEFIDDMPYRKAPYSGRNWGHPWHSLCSYHGKLKPAIAHFMIEKFTEQGETVLDPLCGVGTIPLEACLQGRIGIGNDLSELAYIVSKAKLERPSLSESQLVVGDLNKYIQENVNQPFVDEDVHRYESFGFNGKVSSYFHPNTYREILCARRFFVAKIRELTPAEAMVYSCFLHVLHGNRPYALSRNSHPLTPYSPKGDFIYKNVIEHISNKMNNSYKKGDFNSFKCGQAILGDYNELTASSLSVDTIISSPPFADSIRFYMQNWMRLWLCGWESDDYKHAESSFLDQKQKKDFDVYYSFFEMCAAVLKTSGKVILHLGKTDNVDMAEELSKRASYWFEEIYRGYEDVKTIEKHGIKDKGATVEHQFLFLQKK
ncbi:MAG: DNA methyltransferase [Christensenellales bacterium]|jgi:DNA modification methylase